MADKLDVFNVEKCEMRAKEYHSIENHQYIIKFHNDLRDER